MDGRNHYDTRVSENYVASLLTELAQGPIGAALVELAGGRAQIVVKENQAGAGWVVRVEAIPPAEPKLDPSTGRVVTANSRGLMPHGLQDQSGG